MGEGGRSITVAGNMIEENFESDHNPLSTILISASNLKAKLEQCDEAEKQRLHHIHELEKKVKKIKQLKRDQKRKLKKATIKNQALRSFLKPFYHKITDILDLLKEHDLTKSTTMNTISSKEKECESHIVSEESDETMGPNNKNRKSKKQQLDDM